MDTLNSRINVEKKSKPMLIVVISILVVLFIIIPIIVSIVQTPQRKLLKASKDLTAAKINQLKVNQKLEEAKIYQDKANKSQLIAETTKSEYTQKKAKRAMLGAVENVNDSLKAAKKFKRKAEALQSKALVKYDSAIRAIKKKNSKVRENYALYGSVGTGAPYSRKWSRYYLDHTQEDTFVSGRRLKSGDTITLRNVSTGGFCSDDKSGLNCNANEPSQFTHFKIYKTKKIPKYYYEYIGIEQDPYEDNDYIHAGDWVFLKGGRTGDYCSSSGPAGKVSCQPPHKGRYFKIFLNQDFSSLRSISDNDVIGLSVLDDSEFLTYGTSTLSGGVAKEHVCNGNYTEVGQMTCDRRAVVDGSALHLRII